MDGILLIAGNATAGKDTFFKGLNLLYGGSVKRFAFADALKKDCEGLSHKIFKKGISELSSEEKNLFRPILVDYGNIMREVSPLHWVEEVDKEVSDWRNKLFYDRIFRNGNYKRNAIITDCRYENELEHFKKYTELDIDVKLLYVERYDVFGNLIPPANEIEEKNNEILKKRSDYQLRWMTFGKTLKDEELENLVKHIVYYGEPTMRDFFES